MSDSGSDDEFLSADEGDYEDGTSKTTMEEEEVDEIMDMLMSKEQNSDQNKNVAQTISNAKEQETSSDVDSNKSNDIPLQVPTVSCNEEQNNRSNTATANINSLKGENQPGHDDSKSDNDEDKKTPLETNSNNDENENETEPLQSLEDMIEESLKNESKTPQTESEIDKDKHYPSKENKPEKFETQDKAVSVQDGPIETQSNQQEPPRPETKPEQPNSESEADVVTVEKTLSIEEIQNEKEMHDKPVTNVVNEMEDTRHDLDDLDLDDDSDEDEKVNKNPENMSENIVEESQEQQNAQESSIKELENDTNDVKTDNAPNNLHENKTKEHSQNQTNDSCDSGISVANDDSPKVDGKDLPELDGAGLYKGTEDQQSIDTKDNEATITSTDNETKEPEKETEEDGIEDFDEGNDWGDWGNEEAESNQDDTQGKQDENPQKYQEKASEKSTESVTKKQDPQPPKQTTAPVSQPKGDWGWDSWADDFLIQAAGKVTNMLESVEGQLGIPDPTKMAHVVSKEEKASPKQSPVHTKKKETKPAEPPKEGSPAPQHAQQQQPASSGSSWFGGFGASLTGLVQNTSTDLVTGGIGALEFIGKKTVDMLSDGDPGLRQARDTLAGKKKTNLSALLREAKETSEKNPTMRAKTSDEVNFNDYFEKFQGNVNLDALEMLSNECDNKLERILRLQSHEAKHETTQLLTETREKFTLPDDMEENESNSDFKKDLFATTKQLKMKVTCSKLLNTWTKLKEKSKDPTSDPKECFNNTLSGLAELTSRCVEFYRKVADMFLATDMQAKDLAIQRASALHSISMMFLIELTHLTNGFAQQIAGNSDTQNIVTDIYLEGSNCNSIVRDCHDLVLPILQCCIVK